MIKLTAAVALAFIGVGPVARRKWRGGGFEVLYGFSHEGSQPAATIDALCNNQCSNHI